MSAKPTSQGTNQTALNFKRFKTLTMEQQAAVAAAMTSRMLPNYALFAQVCEFGDVKVMQDALNILWEKQQVKQLKLNFDKLLEKIEPNVPDVADFDMFGVYPALDFAMSLISLCNGLSGSNDFGFVDVCKLSNSTVTNLIEHELAAIKPEFDDDDIEQHELMVYENEMLAALIDMVAEHEKPSKTTLVALKECALADGISNIAIEF